MVPEAYLTDHRRCPSFAGCHPMIRGSTASTDTRITSAGPFYPGVQLGSTSMVHLRPILAMLRSSGLPCFLLGVVVGADDF